MADNTAFCLNFDSNTSRIIGITRGITGAGTLSVSLAALVIILLLRAYKTHGHRLFLYLILATLFHSPTYILEVLAIDYQDETSEQPLCTITGVYTMYMSWLQNLIVFWVTIYLFRVVVLRVMFETKKLEAIVGVVLLFVPIIFALVPLINAKYGISGAWCWIRSKKPTNCSHIDSVGIIYQYTLWFVPVVLELLILTVLTSIMIIMLCARGFLFKKYAIFQYEYRRLLRDSLPLLVFPFIFCCINCFELSLYAQNGDNLPLWLLNAVITPLKGILMMLSYLLPMVWIRIKDWCRKKSLSLSKDSWGNRGGSPSSHMDTVSVRFQTSGGNDYYGSVEVIPHSKKDRRTEQIEVIPLAKNNNYYS